MTRQHSPDLPFSPALASAPAGRPGRAAGPGGPGAGAGLKALDGPALGLMGLLCLIWSLQQVSLKAVSPLASPMLMVALRSVVALALLLGLMGWRGERLQPQRWRAGVLVGGLFGVEYWLVSAALKLTAASHVVVFLYTAPIFAALGLHLRLPAERLGARQAAGIALAFAGIALAFLAGQAQSATPGSAGSAAALLGDVLALLAGAAWGMTTVAIRCSALSAAPPTEMLVYQLAGAVLLLLPGAWISGQWHFEASTAVWLHLGFQSLVVSFASFLAWCWLLGRYLASRLGSLAFLTPLFGVLLGHWLLQEALQPAFVAGSALVLLGIGLVSLPARRT